MIYDDLTASLHLEIDNLREENTRQEQLYLQYILQKFSLLYSECLLTLLH